MARKKSIRDKAGMLLRQQIEVYILLYWSLLHKAPSYQEIAQAVNRSVPRIQQHLKIMVNEGKIDYIKNMRRGVRLTRSDLAIRIAKRLVLKLYDEELPDKVAIIAHELNNFIVPEFIS